MRSLEKTFCNFFGLNKLKIKDVIPKKFSISFAKLKFWVILRNQPSLNSYHLFFQVSMTKIFYFRALTVLALQISEIWHSGMFIFKNTCNCKIFVLLKTFYYNGHEIGNLIVWEGGQIPWNLDPPPEFLGEMRFLAHLHEICSSQKKIFGREKKNDKKIHFQKSKPQKKRKKQATFAFSQRFCLDIKFFFQICF